MMLNNFIYAKTKSLFEQYLINNEISEKAIVFIEDTKEIWNHGHYFGGAPDTEIDPTVISDIQLAISQLEANKLDASVAESTYVAKNDLPDFTSYLNKETADTLYATISQYNELSNSVSQLETNISNKIDKTELATINGQSLINGGDITISGGTEWENGIPFSALDSELQIRTSYPFVYLKHVWDDSENPWPGKLFTTPDPLASMHINAENFDINSFTMPYAMWVLNRGLGLGRYEVRVFTNNLANEGDLCTASVAIDGTVYWKDSAYTYSCYNGTVNVIDVNDCYVKDYESNPKITAFSEYQTDVNKEAKYSENSKKNTARLRMYTALGLVTSDLPDNPIYTLNSISNNSEWETSASSINISLEPNMCYDFTKYRSISGLTISDIGQYLDEGERLSHNLVRFYPQNIISLTLPDYIYWADGSLPNIDEPNCIYELSFIIRYVSESTKQVTGTWSKFKLA